MSEVTNILTDILNDNAYDGSTHSEVSSLLKQISEKPSGGGFNKEIIDTFPAEPDANTIYLKTTDASISADIKEFSGLPAATNTSRDSLLVYVATAQTDGRAPGYYYFGQANSWGVSFQNNATTFQMKSSMDSDSRAIYYWKDGMDAWENLGKNYNNIKLDSSTSITYLFVGRDLNIGGSVSSTVLKSDNKYTTNGKFINEYENSYDEFMYINSKWEKLGYGYSKAEIDNKLDKITARIEALENK